MSAVCSSTTVDGPGDGPAVVLGGSLGTTLAMWEPQLSSSRGAHRAGPFDHRGHGGSPVPHGSVHDRRSGPRRAGRCSIALGLERVSYCGLSIGGMVGQWLADQRARADPPAGPDLHGRAPAATVGLDSSGRRWCGVPGTPEAVADAVLARWFTRAVRGREPEVVARRCGE